MQWDAPVPLRGAVLCARSGDRDGGGNAGDAPPAGAGEAVGRVPV